MDWRSIAHQGPSYSNRLNFRPHAVADYYQLFASTRAQTDAVYVHGRQLENPAARKWAEADHNAMQQPDCGARVVERHLRLLTQLLSFLSGHMTGVPLATLPGESAASFSSSSAVAGGGGGAADGSLKGKRRRSSNAKAKKKFMSAVELVEQARRLDVPVSRVGGGWGVEYNNRQKLEELLKKEKEDKRERKKENKLRAVMTLQRCVKKWKAARRLKAVSFKSLGVSFDALGGGFGGTSLDEEGEGYDDYQTVSMAVPALFGCVDFVNQVVPSVVHTYVGLQELNLRGACLGLKHETVTAISGLAELRKLDLSGTGPSATVGDDSLLALAKLKQLEVLELCCWPLTTKGVVAWSDCVSGSGERMRTQSLSGDQSEGAADGSTGSGGGEGVGEGAGEGEGEGAFSPSPVRKVRVPPLRALNLADVRALDDDAVISIFEV